MAALLPPLRFGRAAVVLAGLLAYVLVAGSSGILPGPRATAPPYGPWHPACRGKPMPPIGSVAARITDRPAPDRAVVTAEWCCGAMGEDCCISLVLPEGAFLVDGREEVHFAPGEARATVTWQVQFPLGAPSDLVVRTCATIPDGPCSCETAVRLTD